MHEAGCVCDQCKRNTCTAWCPYQLVPCSRCVLSCASQCPKRPSWLNMLGECRFPQLLQQDLEQRTRGAVALLVSYGLRDEQLLHVLTSAPRVLAQSLASLHARIFFARTHLGASLQVMPAALGVHLLHGRPDRGA